MTRDREGTRASSSVSGWCVFRATPLASPKLSRVGDGHTAFDWCVYTLFLRRWCWLSNEGRYTTATRVRCAWVWAYVDRLLGLTRTVIDCVHQ